MNQNDRLPIDNVAGAVCQSIRSGNAVLQAEPGAGKSTLLPLRILESGFTGKILMLEPRRIAAQNVAERLASQLNEPLGGRIGLRMRGRSVVSRRVRLEVVTEGVLTRILQTDPLLDGVSLVIFDEFHERSLHADIGLALCLDVQREVRPDLRLLVMSATLDSDVICQHLGVQDPITCQVRQYPVEVFWRATKHTTILQAVAKSVVEALHQHPGDVLVFLPGKSEIESVARLLQHGVGTEVTVHRLHRGVSSKAQEAATRANRQTASHRRVILSTSIAETSITIEGVGIVIDSGIERRTRLDISSGIEKLESVMANKASAVQRTGRAGRTRQGVCYRLWSEESHASRAASWQPEIKRAELSSLLLESAVWGAVDIATLPWIDTPPSGAIAQAKALLTQLGIWSTDGLTAHGRIVAKLPVSPRVGHMLVWAAQHGGLSVAAAIATVLEETAQQTQTHLSPLVRQRLKTTSRRQRQLVERAGSLVDNSSDEPENDFALLLAQAYPDRIACRRTTSTDDRDIRYLLSNGVGAVIREDDPLTQHEYLVIANLGGQGREARIFAALPLNIELLQQHSVNHFDTTEVVQWDIKKERVIAEKQLRVGAVIVQRQMISEISNEQRASALIDGIRKSGIGCLNLPESICEWQARVDRLRQLEGNDSDLPAVDNQSLLAQLEQWLTPYLQNTRSLKDLRRLDFGSILTALLQYPQQQRLEQLMPEKYKVPSGALHKIRYMEKGNPVLSVKLQEMFGCRENPAIANGRIALKIELLSPARRPVQVTEDLGNFWHNSYPAIKKELAGRYPKHPWPDDPLKAEPTAHTRSRKR